MTKNFQKGLKIKYCFLNHINDKLPNDTVDEWNLCGENINYMRNNIQIEGHPGEYYYDLYF